MIPEVQTHMNSSKSDKNQGLQLYANLMDEARVRLHAVRDAIEIRDTWAPRLLREFCWLQLRMLCEEIAIGCLIAHGDIKNKSALKSWNLPDIMKKLESLNAESFPRGVRFETNSLGVHIADYNLPQLSKKELIILWQKSGNFLHRGSAKSLFLEPEKGPVVDLDEILMWGQKIKNLLEQHIITSADQKRHILAALSADEFGGRSSVWFAE